MQGEDGRTRGEGGKRRVNLLWITVRGNQLFLELVSPDRHAGEEIIERVSAGNAGAIDVSSTPRLSWNPCTRIDMIGSANKRVIRLFIVGKFCLFKHARERGWSGARKRTDTPLR